MFKRDPFLRYLSLTPTQEINDVLFTNNGLTTEVLVLYLIRQKMPTGVQGLVAAKVFPMSMTNRYLTLPFASRSIAVLT